LAVENATRASAVAHAVEGAAGRALLGAYALVGIGLLWSSLTWPLIHDAPILHYIGWRIAHGAVPYRDLFDMNQPGVYVIHLAVVTLVGAGDLAWRSVDLAWLAAGALLIRAFARPWGSLASTGAALAFAVYHLASGAWHAGQRDYMLTPFIVGGALGVASWRERSDQGTGALALGGLALGWAITMKPHVAVLALALGGIVAFTSWAATTGTTPAVACARGSGAHRRPIVVYLAALAAAPAAVVVWLAMTGALGAWWDIVSGYLVPLYSRLTRSEDWRLYRTSHWIPLAAAVVLSVASMLRAREFGPRLLVALVGLGYGLLHFFGQRKGWEYHLYPLAAFAVILAFAGLDRVLRSRAWLLSGALVASLVVLLVLLTSKGAESVQADWIRDKERAVQALVDDLAPRLAPSDTVQVLDTTEGGIHALLRLERVEPTRFLYDFHFYHHVDAPMIRRLRAELVHDLAARPPRAIVLFAHGWPRGGDERVKEFPELAEFLARSYSVVEQRPWYTILAQRDRP
jgi:hypothetical protein